MKGLYIRKYTDQLRAMTVANNANSKKSITLREFESLGYQPNDGCTEVINEADFQDLQKFVQEQGKSGARVLKLDYRKLTAKNYVGILQTKSGLTIEILPKIDLSENQPNSNEGQSSEEREKQIFLTMLRAYRGTEPLQISKAKVHALRSFPLLEAFIAMFIAELLLLTHRGLARHYTPVEENRRVLKGKLLIAKQLRYNFIHPERFYVRYAEFSANRPINRLLKSAISLLQRISRNPSNQSKLRQAWCYFDEVPLSNNIATDLERARIDRTMNLYDKLFPWVRMFLQGSAPSTYRGDTLSIALLFPMEKIFEDYIAARLRKELPDWTIRTQEKKHHLVDENTKGKQEFFLKPDIVARHRNKKDLWIIDAKWKYLDKNNNHSGISQSDLYQMFAYGKKYCDKEGCNPVLSLLYPYTPKFPDDIKLKFDGNLHLRCQAVHIANDSIPIFSSHDKRKSA